MSSPAIWYPYNDFGYYYNGGMPLAGKRAERFVEERNKCKGGRWELHTREQFAEWYKKKGQHLDGLKFFGVENKRKRNGL